jgi:hypothetical protein
MGIAKLLPNLARYGLDGCDCLPEMAGQNQLHIGRIVTPMAFHAYGVGIL